jgi:GLPGLI family protein
MKNNIKYYLNRYCLILACLFFLSNTFGQQRDISKKIIIDDCTYNITYVNTFVRDTIKKEPKYDKQVLEIGNNLSHYYSLYADKIDSIDYEFSKRLSRQNKDGSDGYNPNKEAGLKIDDIPKDEDYYCYVNICMT